MCAIVGCIHAVYFTDFQPANQRSPRLLGHFPCLNLKRISSGILLKFFGNVNWPHPEMYTKYQVNPMHDMKAVALELC